MKKIALFLVIAAAAPSLFAQTKKPVKKTTAPVAPAPAPLKTHTDSLSYAIGAMVANFSRQQGITELNTTQVVNAINAEMKGKQALLTPEQCQQVMMDHVAKQRAQQATEDAARATEGKQEGAAFLAENKTKPGVVTTASGLQYMVLTEGTGPKPAATDKIKCNYEGRLIDGKVFDSSDKQGHPIEIEVDHVIRGWTEALQLMPVGSKWRLFIPSDLAYGDQQAGPDIKPGSTLIFDVELLEIVKQ
ncbi:MAG TPA: FKBP-type peptidyl-prolyl cis-trans isomerase [Puia sp.]|nr:FKBP-type peptidyl-prolyl cis-trans isomerase [Puia sp.]